MIAKQRMVNFQSIVNEIQRVENAAMQAGFPIASRALNQAKNAIGWEVAGNVDLADLARVGKRAGE